MFDAALLACAAHVHPETVAAIIRHESGGNPWAVNVNKLSKKLQPRPTSSGEAVAAANRFIAQGYTVDLGLMQINNRNLPALGYSIEQTLDPCTNVSAGATILRANYISAASRFGPGQTALKAALSAYNTGNFENGFLNGYVAAYYGDVPVLDSLRPIPRTFTLTNIRARSPAAEPTRPRNIYAADAQVWFGE